MKVRDLFPVLSLTVALFLPQQVQAQDHIIIGRPDDQPLSIEFAAYTVKGKPSDIVTDPAMLKDLAGAVQNDVSSFVSNFNVTDPRALATIYKLVGQTSTLDGSYAAALQDFDFVRVTKTKPSEKMTACLVETAIAQTCQNPGTDFDATLARNLDNLLSVLPYDYVSGILKQELGYYKSISQNMLVGSIINIVDPTVTYHQISVDGAWRIIDSGYTVQYILPHKAAIVAELQKIVDSNPSTPEASIWPDKDVTLTQSASLTPISIGIWDSGVDMSLFKANDPDIGTGKANGKAWNDDGTTSDQLLLPLGQTAQQYAELQQYLSGESDSDANISSPAAIAYQEKLASLPADQVDDFFVQINQLAGYCHGTAVAGISIKGNPAARLIVARIEVAKNVVPADSTEVDAKQSAAARYSQVDFFSSQGARVVNISWGDSLFNILSGVNEHHPDQSPDDNAQSATDIFNIEYSNLYKAIKSNPNILFVVAAGNDEEDQNQHDYLPADFGLKNMIVVGAVDDQGEQTSFTTTANVDVYADGFEVPCRIPGGDTITWSGTSFAAPAVTNLAAKILAINPALNPEQVKKLIIDHCDTNVEDGVQIKLVDPKKTLAALTLAP